MWSLDQPDFSEADIQDEPKDADIDVMNEKVFPAPGGCTSKAKDNPKAGAVPQMTSREKASDSISGRTSQTSSEKPKESDSESAGRENTDSSDASLSKSRRWTSKRVAELKAAEVEAVEASATEKVTTETASFLNSEALARESQKGGDDNPDSRQTVVPPRQTMAPPPKVVTLPPKVVAHPRRVVSENASSKSIDHVAQQTGGERLSVLVTNPSGSGYKMLGCQVGNYEIEVMKKRVSIDKFHEHKFNTRNKDRPDVTFTLGHFTKSDLPCNRATTQDASFDFCAAAFKRFASILENRKVADCLLPHFGNQEVRAVCFTEMTHASLSVHAETYSPWGICFSKSFLFNVHKANPAIYMRGKGESGSLWEATVQAAAGDADRLRYMTPLIPDYQDSQQNLDYKSVIDYTHEREWRTPGPVEFTWDNISHVYVPDKKVFKELLPDLYESLWKNDVDVRTLDLVQRKGDCANGYACINGNRCAFGHSKDQKVVFSHRENAWWNENAWQNGPSSSSCGPI